MTIAGARSFRCAARHGWVEHGFADWDVGITSRIEVRVECDDQAGGESEQNRRTLGKPTRDWGWPISQKQVSHSSVWRDTAGASNLSKEKFVVSYPDFVITWRLETVNQPAPGRQKRHDADDVNIIAICDWVASVHVIIVILIINCVVHLVVPALAEACQQPTWVRNCDDASALAVIDTVVCFEGIKESTLVMWAAWSVGLWFWCQSLKEIILVSVIQPFSTSPSIHEWTLSLSINSSVNQNKRLRKLKSYYKMSYWCSYIINAGPPGVCHCHTFTMSTPSPDQSQFWPTFKLRFAPLKRQTKFGFNKKKTIVYNSMEQTKTEHIKKRTSKKPTIMTMTSFTFSFLKQWYQFIVLHLVVVCPRFGSRHWTVSQLNKNDESALAVICIVVEIDVSRNQGTSCCSSLSL